MPGERDTAAATATAAAATAAAATAKNSSWTWPSDNLPRLTKEVRIVLEPLNLPVKRKRSLSAEDSQNSIKKVKFGNLILTVNCVIDTPRKPGLSCSVCRKSFKEASALRYHQIHHPELQEEERMMTNTLVGQQQQPVNGVVGSNYRHSFPDSTGSWYKAAKVRVKSPKKGNISVLADTGQVMKKFVPGAGPSPSPSPPLSDCGTDVAATSVNAVDCLSMIRAKGEQSTAAVNGQIRSTILVTPPPSVGDVSEQAAVVLNISDGGGQLGTHQESHYYDEDDFDVVIEGAGGSTGGESEQPVTSVINQDVCAIPVVMSSSSAGVSSSSPLPPPLSEMKIKSPPRKLGVKEIVRKHSKALSALPNDRRRTVGGANNSRAAAVASSRRYSVDSSDDSIAVTGYYLLGEERLLPRQSLRRDVKNDKRISYTTTKITGDLNTSSGSNSSSGSGNSKTAVTAQQQRRSGVSLSPVSSQRAVTGSETHQQNGCLSDCSTPSDSSSERRFSERRFTGDKPFLCNHCPLSFSSHEKKAAHEKTHVEKPVECPYCEMRFSLEISLRKHVKFHR